MLGFGIWELLIILVIILLLFGVKRLPQLGSSLGSGIKNFSKSLKEGEEGDNKPDDTSEGTDDKQNQ